MKQYLKNLEQLLIEEKCHTVEDSQMIGRLIELADKDEPKAPHRVSQADSRGFYLVTDRCPRCRIVFPLEVIITYCPNCGQHIKRK